MSASMRRYACSSLPNGLGQACPGVLISYPRVPRIFAACFSVTYQVREDSVRGGWGPDSPCCYIALQA